MTNKICRSFLFVFFLFGFCFNLLASLSGGLDRAETHEEHIDASEDFMLDAFMSQGVFNPYKIEKFIERLKREKIKLKEDLIETKALEDIELYIKKPKKAKDKRSNPDKVNKNPLVIGYDEYLIPKLEELLDAVLNSKPKVICEALVHDFIRGYAAYYIPNFKRTVFPHDVDIVRALKHVFKSYVFDRNSEKPEAVNLRAEKKDLQNIRKCLGYKISEEHYLTEQELRKLKGCHWDISRLNPGVSPLWTKPDKEAIEQQLEAYRKYYPRKEEKVYIKKVIYRGVGSPKVNAYFMREDKEVEIKLKMGGEVHTELVVSSLFRHLGFNQDYMRYQKSRKIYLEEDMTYDMLASQIANKNGIEHVNRFFWGHGKDDNGEEWVLIKDFLFEIRPDDELRAANLNFSSWDMQDRREYRALMLTWGWVGINDTKYENFKLIFKRTKENGLVPFYRLQDTGVGLGTQSLIRKPSDVFEMLQYYKVNGFPEHYVKWTQDKSQVKIRWNDFAIAPGMFKRTTWYDLKWAARLILNLTKSDLFRCLVKAGMPKPVAKIYYYKFLKRRNDFIDAFGLEDEFVRNHVPDLKEYNEKDENGKYIIKKGKVVQKSFEGKNDIVQIIDKWSTFIPGLLRSLGGTMDFWSKQGNYADLKAQGGGDGFGPKISLQQYQKEGDFFKIPLGVGVEALLSRKVERTKQRITVAGKTHQYAITDTLKIRFMGSSPLFNKILSSLRKLSFSFDLSFFEREWSHIHFEDDVKKAYFGKFLLFKVIGDIKGYAAKHLEPMDIIKTHMNYGIDASLDVSLKPIDILVVTSAGVGFRVKKFLTNHYIRDQFGQLRVMKEQSVRQDFSTSFKLLEIDTFEAKLPLLSLGFGAGRFKMKFNSYFIPRGETVRDGVEDYLTDELKAEQAKELKKGVEESDAFVNNYTLETKGSYTNFSFGALFLFNKEKSRSKALTQVKQGEDVKRTFYRYALFKETSFGLPNLTIDFGTTEILTKNRKSVEIVAESELTDKEKTLYAIRIEDYYRVKTREKVEALIRDHNRRFSEIKTLPFYRGYEIPEKMNSDKFRKIYAHTRIHVSGKHLEESLLSLKIVDIRKRLKEHFRSVPSTSRFRVRMQKHHITKLIKKIKKRDELTIKDKKKRIKYFAQILSHLRIETFGLGFLKGVLKKKALFVMGDISGIFRNFSTMQSLQQQQKRRFSGMSWGKLSKKMPLQKFMRNHRFVPVSNHFRKDVKDSEYFGRLELGVPKNIEDVYDMNDQF